ncbi:MAG: YitT family protein [Firmicutes bacterium]|nr:YitT family protein [Bacillota bacterium]
MFFKKKQLLDENIMKNIYKKDRLVRYSQFFLGALLVALSFNLFILPNKIVYGMSGIGVIMNATLGLEPSTVILIGSIILLIMSYFLLGKEKTVNSILGSIVVPIFIRLTAFVPEYVQIDMNDPLLITLFGAFVTGFGMGLVFKAGYTTGGTDILNQIVSKYFHMSLGNAMYCTDGLIVASSFFFFGASKLLYSIISLYIISLMTDKVILGVSNSKAFYIITDHETAVKKFIMEHLSHGVTVLDGRGGFTGNHQKVIMCIIPTKEYFVAKEGIREIDKDAFFLVTDAYEVNGGE